MTDAVPEGRTACSYCGADSAAEAYYRFEYAGRAYALHRCTNCSSLLYVPKEIHYRIPQPYTPEYKAAIAEGCKYYFETGYSTDFIAMCALAALPALQQDPQSIFVDVGAGLGLSTYFINSIWPGEVVAVDPSYSGELAQHYLGVKVHTAYFEELPAALLAQLASRPSVLHLNSVIEHLMEPYEVITSLLQRANVQMIAAVVPDQAHIREGVAFAELVQTLAPGDHLHLPSVEGMQRLYQRLGFSHVACTQAGGLMVAVAARAPIRMPTTAETEHHRREFLRRLMDHPHPQIAAGAAARLLPIALMSNSELLEVVVPRLNRLLPVAVSLEQLGKPDSGWDEIPFYLGSASFWLGVHRYRLGQYQAALARWNVLERFIERLMRDYPAFAAEALSLCWESRLYRVLSLARLGERDRARRWAQRIIEAQQDTQNGPRADQVQRAREFLPQLG